MTGRIVILNGAPGSGKSSIARAYDINVAIEIPGGSAGGSPVKYEIDKDSSALFVDRIVNVPMFYPNNYGFVPNTLHEDGDPVDVMVRAEVTLVAGSVIRCRLIGVLHMEDDGGQDDKLIAMPIEKVDPFQAEIQDLAGPAAPPPRAHLALLRALQGPRGGQVGQGHRLGRQGRRAAHPDGSHRARQEGQSGSLTPSPAARAGGAS